MARTRGRIAFEDEDSDDRPSIGAPPETGGNGSHDRDAPGAPENDVLDLQRLALDGAVLRLLSSRFARRYGVVPLCKRDLTLFVATARPRDRGLASKIESWTGLEVRLVAASRPSLLRALDEHYPAAGMRPRRHRVARPCAEPIHSPAVIVLWQDAPSSSEAHRQLQRESSRSRSQTELLGEAQMLALYGLHAKARERLTEIRDRFGAHYELRNGEILFVARTGSAAGPREGPHPS